MLTLSLVKLNLKSVCAIHFCKIYAIFCLRPQLISYFMLHLPPPHFSNTSQNTYVARFLSVLMPLAILPFSLPCCFRVKTKTERQTLKPEEILLKSLPAIIETQINFLFLWKQKFSHRIYL